jgi:hypothetical protein
MHGGDNEYPRNAQHGNALEYAQRTGVQLQVFLQYKNGEQHHQDTGGKTEKIAGSPGWQL